MTKHTRVIPCSCGQTFETEDTFEAHKRAQSCKEFNQATQEWLDEHLGGQIAEWHRENAFGMGGVGAYHTAKQQDNIGIEPTDENVREAAIQYARSALAEGNVRELFYDEFHD
jgi:hypothetical protein